MSSGSRSMVSHSLRSKSPSFSRGPQNRGQDRRTATAKSTRLNSISPGSLSKVCQGTPRGFPLAASMTASPAQALQIGGVGSSGCPVSLVGSLLSGRMLHMAPSGPPPQRGQLKCCRSDILTLGPADSAVGMGFLGMVAFLAGGTHEVPNEDPMLLGEVV